MLAVRCIVVLRLASVVAIGILQPKLQAWFNCMRNCIAKYLRDLQFQNSKSTIGSDVVHAQFNRRQNTHSAADATVLSGTSQQL